jgi:hypothetical protein
MSSEAAEKDSPEHEERLHIFVNRRRFDEGDGVKARMTGGEIAALVQVPPAIAVVRWASGPHEGQEIPVGETVEIKNGQHFLVTRRVVEGG